MHRRTAAAGALVTAVGFATPVGHSLGPAVPSTIGRRAAAWRSLPPPG